MCYYYHKLSAMEFCDNLTPVNKMNKLYILVLLKTNFKICGGSQRKESIKLNEKRLHWLMNLILEKLFINLFFLKVIWIGCFVCFWWLYSSRIYECLYILRTIFIYDHASARKINAYYLFFYYSNQVYILMSDLPYLFVNYPLLFFLWWILIWLQ